jgi:hypothetical protein
MPLTLARQVIFGLLGMSLMLLLFVVGGYAVHRSATPGLRALPAESERTGDLKMVQEASDLASLRRICASWVKDERDLRAAMTAALDQLEIVFAKAVVAMSLIWLIFAIGLSYAYLAIVRVSRDRETPP